MRRAVGLAAAFLAKAFAEDLHVSSLGLNDAFAELNEDVLYEAAGEDESGHAKYDRGERDRGTHTLTQDVSEGELDEHGFKPGDARRRRCSCAMPSMPESGWRARW